MTGSRSVTLISQFEHLDWEITVSRLDGDPVPHVVAWGDHPVSGLLEAHADRLPGATPATVRSWVESLLVGPPVVDVAA